MSLQLLGQQKTDGQLALRRIAALRGPAQVRELRELLLHFPDEPAALDTFFYYERQLRPALRALLKDPQAGNLASAGLAFFGLPEDVASAFAASRLSLYGDGDPDWAYELVSSMLHPTSEAQWAFLRDAAMGQFQSGWLDAGAIQSLMLIASARSRGILEQVRQHNPRRRELAAEALRYVASNPRPLVDVDLTRLAERVARAVEIGEWQENGAARYNEARDKALVDCVFVAGLDRLHYTGTFHRVRGQWTLRGIRETLQQYGAAPPVPKKVESK
ncbi:MAG: hypothetical protein U0R19_21985 [Bryobacteraceae bacterium]